MENIVSIIAIVLSIISFAFTFASFIWADNRDRKIVGKYLLNTIYKEVCRLLKENERFISIKRSVFNLKRL